MQLKLFQLQWKSGVNYEWYLVIIRCVGLKQILVTKGDNKNKRLQDKNCYLNGSVFISDRKNSDPKEESQLSVIFILFIFPYLFAD